MTNQNFTLIPIPEFEELVRKVVFEEINGALKLNTPQKDELLTREELAQKLQKCTKTISNYMKDGMPFKMITKNPYFIFSEVLEYMDSKKIGVKNKRR